MQCIKHRVSIGHACQKNMNASPLKLHIPIFCETKLNTRLTYMYTDTVIISVSISARLRNLSIVQGTDKRLQGPHLLLHSLRMYCKCSTSRASLLAGTRILGDLGLQGAHTEGKTKHWAHLTISTLEYLFIC